MQSPVNHRSVTVKLAVLVGSIIVVFAIAAPVANGLGGLWGISAAAAAAGLCVTGACLALIASHFLQGPRAALQAMLLGMAARMGIPLAFGVAIHLRGGPLAEAGLVYYLLVFYPVALAVETLLSLSGCRHDGVAVQLPPQHVD